MGKKKRERESSSIHTSIPSIAQSSTPTTRLLLTASPSAASTVPQHSSATEFPKPTQKPLTISDSQLWHHCPAHIHPTALQSLMDGYTKDDSMYTTCMQAKCKLQIIKVKTKHTTKPLENIHSNVCGPFSTPTTASHHYYIPFIDNFACYTSELAFPDNELNTGTLGYKLLQGWVDSKGQEVKWLWWDIGHRDYNNKTTQLVLAVCEITYELCPPYTGQTDGDTESITQTITENALCTMIDSKGPHPLWEKSSSTTVYLHQSTPCYRGAST